MSPRLFPQPILLREPKTPSRAILGAVASILQSGSTVAPAPKLLQREVNRNPMCVYWYTDGQPYSIGIHLVPEDQPIAS